MAAESPSKDYRIALIGTGRVGYQFDFGDLPDNHAEAIQQVQSCELVAGVNRGSDKLDDFGRRFGIDVLYHDYSTNEPSGAEQTLRQAGAIVDLLDAGGTSESTPRNTIVSLRSSSRNNGNPGPR